MAWRSSAALATATATLTRCHCSWSPLQAFSPIMMHGRCRFNNHNAIKVQSCGSLLSPMFRYSTKGAHTPTVGKAAQGSTRANEWETTAKLASRLASDTASTATQSHNQRQHKSRSTKRKALRSRIAGTEGAAAHMPKPRSERNATTTADESMSEDRQSARKDINKPTQPTIRKRRGRPRKRSHGGGKPFGSSTGQVKTNQEGLTVAETVPKFQASGVARMAKVRPLTVIDHKEATSDVRPDLKLVSGQPTSENLDAAAAPVDTAQSSKEAQGIRDSSSPGMSKRKSRMMRAMATQLTSKTGDAKFSMKDILRWLHLHRRDGVFVYDTRFPSAADYTVLVSANSMDHIKTMSNVLIKSALRQLELDESKLHVLNLEARTPEDQYLMLDLGGVLIHFRVAHSTEFAALRLQLAEQQVENVDFRNPALRPVAITACNVIQKVLRNK